ncbi:MAG TPA: radical SAM family heme chaperone HemW [Pyrinomonadaceae bacterium]|nr:radical SAM family heme chaperone HemW [Pyrinomonadaceae bacterium]HMP64753.1 radical SAM family heme chaperone HemW [Pyrinomonadaceae bacterium]
MQAGVYLHIPFCKSQCSYCDFATDVYRDSGAVERYVDALCREIKSEPPALVGGRTSGEPHRNTNWPAANAAGSDIDTVYFGGGTPSLIDPEQVEKIIDSVFSVFSVADSAEITMEMNPATVTPEKLAAFRELGINRASFGVQTFNDRDLKLLARGHNANDARNTFKMLREAGFDNVSFDLIAGLPGQTMDDWKVNLDEAIKMSPEHISLYLLEIHESTPLAEQIRSGRRTPIDEELAAEMYEVMLDRLAASGYEQYEISNFSKPGFESRHNTKYWQLEPVYGFGVSAHSFDGQERYANERDTERYVEMIETDASAEVMREVAHLASEFVFLGLRMQNGIDLKGFAEKFGFDLMEKYNDELAEIIDSGLIETANGNLRLTRKGKLFSNEVSAVFV